MILPAQTIRRLGILTPCCERTRHNGTTFGLGPAGYDLRISRDVTLWPGASVLVDAIERFRMPNDVIGFLYSKSTWARLHIEQAGTVIEPGWRGVLRLELNMHSGGAPITIEGGTGVAQVVFHRLEEPTDQPYEGKYQDQEPEQNAIFESDAARWARWRDSE
jgi:dCTP deaminase